eukprot:NODE_8885_length_391_cov_14.511696_g7997_i0.p2 GENE.NODE_8885_length_391_cov_14.511696_g7997_i0~~NODE_8885_length_391_cov_14.511696_g7997_i0.p2  ORF type:complete len:107 (+),score=34.99 NODE_8885_length_391_cov_14.511696_g7997_i0:24-323(+)
MRPCRTRINAEYMGDKSPIGYKPFVEECLKQKDNVQAAKYISRCTEVGDRVEYYCKVSKFHEAMQDAYQSKEPELLTQIARMTHSQEHRDTIKKMLASM